MAVQLSSNFQPMTAELTTKLKRPTPSTLEEWEHFPTVGDDTAQVRLARAMGYPPSWRVVRDLIRIPVPEYLAKQMRDGRGNPAVTPNGDGAYVMMTTVQDRIYAGDPATQPDGYYNHAAALLASSKLPWRPEFDDVIHDNNDDDYDDNEYCSTSHRNKGGQLKGREARFQEGDVVEVLYDEDEDAEPEWYEATVLKKIEYQDDIRYNVHYHVDDAIQSDVREEKIRPGKKPKPKKRKAVPKKQGGKKKAAAETTTGNDGEGAPVQKRKRGRPAGSKNKKKKVAEEKPLPPEPEEQLPLPEPEEADPETGAEPTRNEPVLVEGDCGGHGEVLDNGDPPWRTAGHEHLGRRIRWTPYPDMNAGTDPCEGTVVAWIAATDVDGEGNPGFVCSRTGEPARLFHVVFEDFGQDFEEWELEECFVEREGEE